MSEPNLGPQGERPAGMDTWIRRRKTYLIDKKMQFTYLAMVFGMLFVMLLGIVISNFMLVIVYQKVLVKNYGDSPDVMRSINLFVMIDVVIVILMLLAAIFYSVLHSHRIAGPIYRFRQTLVRMATGDYNFTVTLRQKDFLKDIAEESNRLLGILQAKNDELRKIRLRLEQIGGKLKEVEGQAENGKELDALANQITMLLIPKDPESAAPGLAPQSALPPVPAPVSAPPAAT